MQMKGFFRGGLLAVAVLSLSGCALFLGSGVPEPCSGPMYRAFDFWLGDWNVQREPSTTQSSAAKLPDASSEISSIVQGCAVQEHYHTDSGYSGDSLNWYDPGLAQWRQTWVDNSGMVLQLAGGLNSQGQMVLSGDQRQDELGQAIQDRISWTPQRDGSVIQLWQSSADAGKTWEEVFRGRYVRKPAAPVTEILGPAQPVY